MTLKRILMVLKGGKGSGNFGHAGRKGERGGSSSSGSVSIKSLKQQERKLEGERKWSEKNRESIRSRYRDLVGIEGKDKERDQTWRKLQEVSISHDKLLRELKQVQSKIANIKADEDLKNL